MKSRITGANSSHYDKALRLCPVEAALVRHLSPLPLLNLFAANNMGANNMGDARKQIREEAQVNDLLNLTNPCRLLTEWLINPRVLFQCATVLIPKLNTLLLLRNENALYAAACLVLVCKHKSKLTKDTAEKNQLANNLANAQSVLRLAHRDPAQFQAASLAVSACLLTHEKKLSLAKTNCQKLLMHIPPHQSLDELTIFQQCYLRIVSHITPGKLLYQGTRTSTFVFIDKLHLLTSEQDIQQTCEILQELTTQAFARKLTREQEQHYCKALITQLTDPELLNSFASCLYADNKPQPERIDLLKSACQLLHTLCYRSHDSKKYLQLLKDLLPVVLDQIDVSAEQASSLSALLLRAARINLNTDLRYPWQLQQADQSAMNLETWLGSFLKDYIGVDEYHLGCNIIAVGLDHLPAYGYDEMCVFVSSIIHSLSGTRKSPSDNNADMPLLSSLLMTLENMNITVYNILQCLLWNMCLNVQDNYEKHKIAHHLTLADKNDCVPTPKRIFDKLAMTLYATPDVSHLKPQTERVRTKAADFLSYLLKTVPETQYYLESAIATHDRVLLRKYKASPLFRSVPPVTPKDPQKGVATVIQESISRLFNC